MKKFTKIKTGLLRLDAMLGGGIPVGQFMEIYGYEYSGKTTLALEISKVFRNVLYVDFEHKSDPVYHEALNVSVDVVEGHIFEETMDRVLKSVKDRSKNKSKKNQYDMIIIDSLAAAIAKKEYEVDLVKDTMGAKAKAVTRFLIKAGGIFPGLGITCLMVNHRKDKLGVTFGASDYTPGGQQIKFSSIIRLALHRANQKVFEDEDGCFCRIRQTKNQAAQDIPFKKCDYLILRGKGIIRGFEAFDIGIQSGMIQQSGHWYDIGRKRFKGRGEVIAFLNEHDKLRRIIYEKSK